MPRYFIRLAYDGAPYHGWQEQPGGVPTVQSALEDALSKLLRQPIRITGAGRTDAGVNASMMIAHFDSETILPDIQQFPRRINAITGPSIAVYGIRQMHPEAHARFDATARTYHYYASTRRSPFTRAFTWAAPPRLDFDAMNHAASLIVGIRDFTSFSKLHTDVKTNICDVRSARWIPWDNGVMAFEITADRFLRNKVRAVVGTLVDVGRGKLPPEAVAAIIDRRDRGAAGTSMPAHALFLHKVEYPYLIP